MKVWIIFGIISLYALIDEIIQGLERVGRSADIMDFVSDLFGIVLALGLLSFLGFWGSLLSFSSVFIFVLSDVSRLMTLPQYASYAAAFHFTAYTAFTLIWIQWLERLGRFAPGTATWLAVSAITPFGLLALVVLAGPIWDRPLNGFHIGIAGIGIVTAIIVSWAVIRMLRRQ
jgi:hypothetical protein